MDYENDVLPREPWTAEDVAKYMKLSPKSGDRTIRKWASEGLLKCGRIAGRLYFQKNDVDDMIFAAPKRR